MLTPKRKAFAHEYLVDYNQTQAAIRAGFSPRSAYAEGSRLLRNAEVVTLIREIKADQDAAYEHRIMGKYEVLAKITEIANSDIGDLLPVDENGKPYGELSANVLKSAKDRGKSHLIKSVRVKRTPVLLPDGNMDEAIETHVEMYSRHEALRDMGKHHVLFTDHNILSDDESIGSEDAREALAQRLADLAKRKRQAGSAERTDAGTSNGGAV
jgi:hypothetical protein